MKKCLYIVVMVLLLFAFSFEANAGELTPSFDLSTNGNQAALTDDSHTTLVSFNKGDTITITATENALIYGIYITWDCPTVPWTLTTAGGNISCGNEGFIHEYVALKLPSSSVTINIPDNKMGITSIRIFGEGELPHDVQVWEPSCTNADIMIISSHADDEILFFGGILPTYTYTYDADIQVVYMTQFWGWSKVREHEKLDGLWESGIRHYPVSAPFKDYKSEDLSTAESQYDYNALVEYVTEQLRRFKPQVVATHDINGEYGHGYHMLTCKAVMEAVNSSNDANKYPGSAATYGTFDVPKTYIHLYKENMITLDYHIPLEEDYANRTALDIAKEAYTKHVSQQQWWFYVSDTNAYSCAKFGLWRSTVGEDTANDLLCNLKTYKVQAAEEEARLKAEEESRRLEQESIEQASREQESLEQASREQESLEQASREEESRQESLEESSRLKEQQEKEQKTKITTMTIIGFIFVAMIVGCAVFTVKAKKKKS